MRFADQLVAASWPVETMGMTCIFDRRRPLRATLRSKTEQGAGCGRCGCAEDAGQPREGKAEEGGGSADEERRAFALDVSSRPQSAAT